MRRFLTSLFQSETQPKRAQLGLQSLESREVPATVQLTSTGAGFNLFVNTTTPGEQIELRAPTTNQMTILSNITGETTIPSIPITNIVVNGGLTADDKLTISGVPSGVISRVNAFNFDEFTVGAVNAAGKSSLANIRSELNIVGAANSELRILGDADATAKTVTVQQNAVLGLAPMPIQYNLAAGAKTRLSLRTGDGNDTVTITDTPTLGAVGLAVSTGGGQDTFNVERASAFLRLNGNEGDDTFNLAPVARHLANIDRSVFINGGTGTNSLVVHDENRGLLQTVYDAEFSVEPQGSRLAVSQLNLASGATDLAQVAYSGVQSVRYLAPTAAGASTIDVLATAAGVDTVIESGRASEVRVGGGRMDGIAGDVTVNRTDFGGRLILDDTDETAFRFTRLHANSVERSDGLVSFDNNTAFVDLRLGNGLDFVLADAYRTGGGRYVVDTGAGGVLQGVDTGNNWTLNGPRQGSVNGGSLEFRNVETLQGGLGNDHFRFMNNTATFANITADPLDSNFELVPNNALDTIDYSFLGTSVDVNLTAERGSLVGGNIAGRLQGIDAVFGSQVGDTIIGSAGSNVLLGLGGNDTIVGGGGRDILVGGAGADVLSNGNSETIFVGGDATNFTTFQWGFLQREWTRTDATYQQRVNHIRSGGGLNGSIVLNNTTISNDFAQDEIHAGAAPDLIFLHGTDLLGANPPQNPSEIVILP